MKTPSLILVPLLFASATLLAQQGPGGPRPPRGGPDGQNQPGQPAPKNNKGPKNDRPMGPVPAMINALDANHDGRISKEEIRRSPAALKTLDKNGDGQLTVEEFGVPHPHGPKGEGPQGPPRDDEGRDGPKGPPPGADNEEGPQGPPPPPDGADGNDRPKLPPPDRSGPGPKDGGRPPMAPPLPLVHALDANHDGIISAEEIKNAPEALKSLVHNKEGDLTMEDLAPRPPHPPKGGKGGEEGQPPPRNEPAN